MANNPQRPAGSKPADVPSPLVERVRARVAEMTQHLEQRSRAARRTSMRRPKPSRGAAARASTDGVQPLRAVFRELGSAHRAHRRQTGQAVSAPLREAAEEFKRAPTLTTLVAVAAFLDAEGSLAW